MLKPTNYDSLKIEDYTPIKLGGHYLKIIDVTESESKSGNPLIIVRFDFSENDEQAGRIYGIIPAENKKSVKAENRETKA